MSKLFTAKDLETMIQEGKCLGELPADAKFTPMASDVLRREKIAPSSRAAKPSPDISPDQRVSIHDPVLPNAEYNWVPGKDPKTARDLEKFFYSPEIQQLKARMVRIGQRVDGRNYVDGNGGNITIRVGDNLVLCTPHPDLQRNDDGG